MFMSRTRVDKKDLPFATNMIPQDCIPTILSYIQMNEATIYRISLVNKIWFDIIQREEYWRQALRYKQPQNLTCDSKVELLRLFKVRQNNQYMERNKIKIVRLKS
jgi:hypothetical protein